MATTKNMLPAVITPNKSANIFKQMTPALQKATYKVLTELANIDKLTVCRLWMFGKNLKKIRDNPTKYGVNSINLLEDIVGVEMPNSKSYIQKAIKLHTSISLDDLNKWLEYKNPQGKRLITSQHIERLTSIPDTGKRDEMVKKIVDDGLSVDELDYAMEPDRLIKPNGSPGGKHAGGRRRAIPTNAVGKLAQINKIASNVNRDYKVFWNDKLTGVERIAKEVPADKIDDKLIELVDTTVASLTEAEDNCRATRLKLETVKTDLKQRLAVQAKKDSTKAVAAITGG